MTWSLEPFKEIPGITDQVQLYSQVSSSLSVTQAADGGGGLGVTGGSVAAADRDRAVSARLLEQASS